MSLARVNYVEKSRKDNVCGNCRTALPKGSAYRWFTVGFRSNYKRVRCMSSACSPKQSELESSLLSEVYAAMESAEETINGTEPGDYDGIRDAFNEVNEAIQSVASQYREQDEAFGGYGSTPGAERADTLESAEVDDILTDDDFDEWCDDHSDEGNWEMIQSEDPNAAGVGLDEAREACEVCTERRSEWWANVQMEAVEAVNNVELY